MSSRSGSPLNRADAACHHKPGSHRLHRIGGACSMISRGSACGRGAAYRLVVDPWRQRGGSAQYDGCPVSAACSSLIGRQQLENLECQTRSFSEDCPNAACAAAWPDGPSVPRSRSAARPGRSVPRPAPHAVPAPKPAARLHHPAGTSRSGGRHGCNIADATASLQEENAAPKSNFLILQIRAARSVRRVRQSMPSSSIASCAGVSDTLPSFAWGQTNRPRSSVWRGTARLPDRPTREPSAGGHGRPGTRRDAPRTGLCRVVAPPVSPAPSKPLRMSVTPAASHIPHSRRRPRDHPRSAVCARRRPEPVRHLRRS